MPTYKISNPFSGINPPGTPPKPYASLMTVTPIMAQEWLAKSHNKNRKVQTATILKYAEDMRAGRWQINGETIVIGASGNILDGQHRLGAIVEAGRPIETFVISGIEDTSFATLDSGKARTPSDVLGIMGYTQIKWMASIGRLDALYKKRGSVVDTGRDVVWPTTQEVVNEVNLHHEEYLAALHATSGSRHLFGSGTIIGFYWLRFGEIDTSDRDYFFARLGDGLGLLEGDAIYALRQAFLNAQARKRAMSRLWVGGMLIKGWNKFRLHERARILAFAATEDYPEPV